MAPRGLLMDRPAGTGQGRPCQGPRGRRGPRCVLLVTWSSFRGEVRRGRTRSGWGVDCQARAGAKRAPADHLHRRDRRHRPSGGSGETGALSVQRRAGATLKPAAGGDGRLRRGPGGLSCWAEGQTVRGTDQACCGPAGSPGRSRSRWPTLVERAAILAVHCRTKRLGPDVTT